MTERKRVELAPSDARLALYAILAALRRCDHPTPCPTCEDMRTLANRLETIL